MHHVRVHHVRGDRRKRRSAPLITPSFEFLVKSVLRLGYPAPVKTSPSKDKDAASDVTRDNDNPYAKHYGPDADIWSLYLKETEADDKEKVELWKTGLESLLLFVSSSFHSTHISRFDARLGRPVCCCVERLHYGKSQEFGGKCTRELAQGYPIYSSE